MIDSDIIARIESTVTPGVVIYTTRRGGNYMMKGWGIRRDERALIYTIPNNKKPSDPYEKGIAVSEWRQAFAQLVSARVFTRSWFEHCMKRCSSEGGCNFSAIGGVFVLLGDATFAEPGCYRRVEG